MIRSPEDRCRRCDGADTHRRKISRRQRWARAALALVCLTLPMGQAQAQEDANPQPPLPAELPLSRPGNADDPLEAGRQAYTDGDYAEAVELLLTALKDHNQAEVYYYLGLTYYKLTTYSLAIDAFDSARALYGKEAPPNLLFSLALSYYYAHDLEASQDYLNQVLNSPQAAPELKQSAEAQLMQTLRDQSKAYQEGMAAYQSGDLQTAVKDFQELLKLVPDSAEIHYYLGISAYQLTDFNQARSSLRRVISLEPNGDYAESARQTLEVIDKLEKNLARKDFFGSITLGTRGDTNVNFGDSGTNRISTNPGQSLDRSALQDLGSVLGVNLNYSFDQVATLRYNYLLNLYWGLNDNPSRLLNSYDFNLQQHQLSFYHRIPLADWLSLSLDTRGSLELLAGQLYQADAAFRPTLTVYENDHLITTAFIELGAERFPNIQQRDNYNYSLGLDQYLYLWNSQSWLRFGYHFNQVLADDRLSSDISEQNGRITQFEFRSAYSRSDNQFGIGFGLPLGPVQCEFGTLFDFTLYNRPDVYKLYQININPLTGLPLPRQELKDQSAEEFREDTRLTFYASAEWPFADRWKLLANYIRTTNVSNISPSRFNTLASQSYLKDQLDVSVRWEF